MDKRKQRKESLRQSFKGIGYGKGEGVLGRLVYWEVAFWGVKGKGAFGNRDLFGLRMGFMEVMGL